MRTGTSISVDDVGCAFTEVLPVVLVVYNGCVCYSAGGEIVVH